MLSYMLYAAIYLSSLSSGRHLSDATVAQYAHEIERQSIITGVSSFTYVTESTNIRSPISGRAFNTYQHI